MINSNHQGLSDWISDYRRWSHGLLPPDALQYTDCAICKEPNRRSNYSPHIVLASVGAASKETKYGEQDQPGSTLGLPNGNARPRRMFFVPSVMLVCAAMDSPAFHYLVCCLPIKFRPAVSSTRLSKLLQATRPSPNRSYPWPDEAVKKPVTV